MLISRKRCKIEIYLQLKNYVIGNRIWPFKWQQRQWPWKTLKVIHRLQAFLNAIRRTFMQHFTRFHLTMCSRSLCVSCASCINRETTDKIIHSVSKQTVQFFCQNFVAFTPILIKFGRKMVKTLQLYEMHSFSTSPNSRHYTKRRPSKVLQNAESWYLR